MRTLNLLLTAAGLCGLLQADISQAALVLDSGTPDQTKFPLVLDGANYVAAALALQANTTVTDIAGFITAGTFGSSAGDTFTIALYDDASIAHGAPLMMQQASYQADGWNGLSNLHWDITIAGKYWLAFEVSGNDTGSLQLPVVAKNGTHPALGYAFNAGSGYVPIVGEDFGVQVSAVPLPGSLWLFTMPILGLTATVRRKLAA